MRLSASSLPKPSSTCRALCCCEDMILGCLLFLDLGEGALQLLLERRAILLLVGQALDFTGEIAESNRKDDRVADRQTDRPLEFAEIGHRRAAIEPDADVAVLDVAGVTRGAGEPEQLDGFFAGQGARRQLGEADRQRMQIVGKAGRDIALGLQGGIDRFAFEIAVFSRAAFPQRRQVRARDEAEPAHERFVPEIPGMADRDFGTLQRQEPDERDRDGRGALRRMVEPVAVAFIPVLRQPVRGVDPGCGRQTRRQERRDKLGFTLDLERHLPDLVGRI